MSIIKPILQLALDFVDSKRAIKLAKEAFKGGVDWLEAGTPLIKSEGLDIVRTLRKTFLTQKIVADMKIMDAGRIETESAAKAGANIIDVLGVAPDSTIRECIEVARNYGAEIVVDLIGIKNPVERAKEIEQMGANYISVHIAIDEQMEGKISFKTLEEVVNAVNIPVGIAGGINSETVVDAINAGAQIIIVGGAITKAKDSYKAAYMIKQAMETKIKIKTELYKRITYKNIKEVLTKVSTANISDALHRQGEIKNLFPLFKNIKMVGQAITVRTYPGDWAKPVEAIEIAKEQEVIVIDAGGIEPAVWGELATTGAVRKKLAGVVINGAIRDSYEINKMKFPAFAKIITPTAYEPKGFGEINIPIKIQDVRIFPGDWIIGDDDGIVVIPKEKVVEVTNRAMDVLEKENRIRKEIEEGSTLSEVMELLKWEKK